MDIFEKCYGFTEAREAIAGGYYPYFIPLTENEGTEAVFRGHRLIMCGSNNYLGLTTHPKVRQAAQSAIERYGTSCTGSRFLNGTLEMHEQLERELADWVGKEAALVFSTGMQTNLGTISALVGRGDIVILDKEDHASIVDGARLSWGETQRFRHNDMAESGTWCCRGARRAKASWWLWMGYSAWKATSHRCRRLSRSARNMARA